jgi:hypothetical protein
MRRAQTRAGAQMNYRAPRPYCLVGQAGSRELVEEAPAARRATREPQLADVLGLELRRLYAAALLEPLSPACEIALEKLRDASANHHKT